MIKNKASDIMRRLNDEEKQELKLFLASPYFNRKKKIEKLCEILLENSELLDLPETVEEELFKPLFENNKYSYSFIRNLMSELLRLCEIFLVINRYKSNSFSDSNFIRILLNEYNRRFLDRLFELRIRKIREEFSEREIDSEYFYNLGKLEAENIAFFLYRSSMKEVPGHLLRRAEDNFIHILQLMEFDIMDLAVNRSAFDLDLGNELVPGLFKTIDTNKMLEVLKEKESPFKEEIEIRVRLIKLSSEVEDDENYFRLRDLILPGIDKYSNAERSNMFIKLKNYCAFRIYGGSNNFYNEKYSLTRSELESVKYNQKGVGPLFANIYLEIIQNSVHDRELDYAYSVVERFTKEIDPSKQDTVQNMANAWIEFEKRNFEKTLHHLANVNAFNTFLKINTKLLYIKTYYEMNEPVAGNSYVESFRHFIKETNEIGSKRRENLQRNYEIIKKLYRLKFNPGQNAKFEVDELRKIFEKSEIYYAAWYLEKISELDSGIHC